jgi:methionine-rich copper-binding protein CopC
MRVNRIYDTLRYALLALKSNSMFSTIVLLITCLTQQQWAHAFCSSQPPPTASWKTTTPIPPASTQSK